MTDDNGLPEDAELTIDELAAMIKERWRLRDRVAKLEAENAQLRAGVGLSAEGERAVVARWHAAHEAQRCDNCGMMMLDRVQDGTKCYGCGAVEISEGGKV